MAKKLIPTIEKKNFGKLTSIDLTLCENLQKLDSLPKLLLLAIFSTPPLMIAMLIIGPQDCSSNEHNHPRFYVDGLLTIFNPAMILNLCVFHAQCVTRFILNLALISPLEAIASLTRNITGIGILFSALETASKYLESFTHIVFNSCKFVLLTISSIIAIPLAGISNLYYSLTDKVLNLGKTIFVFENKSQMNEVLNTAVPREKYQLPNGIQYRQRPTINPTELKGIEFLNHQYQCQNAKCPRVSLSIFAIRADRSTASKINAAMQGANTVSMRPSSN